MVEKLLAVPTIEVNKEDRFGKTPLHDAARHGYHNVVEMLLASPTIEVNKKDRSGRTPLHRAVQKAHHNVVNMLRACGAER